MFVSSPHRAPKTVIPEVCVATATAIIVDPNDRYSVLIADSAKHVRPVLPGGKVEISDGADGGAAAAYRCIVREAEEELGVKLLNIRQIGCLSAVSRDIRVVPASTLTGAVCSLPLNHTLQPESLVRAHYGSPDFIFVGEAHSFRSTSELSNPRYIDVRTIDEGALSAGHDLILMLYRQMIERGEDRLQEVSLTGNLSLLLRAPPPTL